MRRQRESQRTTHCRPRRGKTQREQHRDESDLGHHAVPHRRAPHRFPFSMLGRDEHERRHRHQLPQHQKRRDAPRGGHQHQASPRTAGTCPAPTDPPTHDRNSRSHTRDAATITIPATSTNHAPSGPRSIVTPASGMTSGPTDRQRGRRCSGRPTAAEPPQRHRPTSCRDARHNHPGPARQHEPRRARRRAPHHSSDPSASLGRGSPTRQTSQLGDDHLRLGRTTANLRVDGHDVAERRPLPRTHP